jgi:DNA topoisomerase-1
MKVGGDALKLKFRANGGARDDDHRQVAQLLVKKCQDLPGQHLFSGSIPRASRIRCLIRTSTNISARVSGGDFTAKHFSISWAASSGVRDAGDRGQADIGLKTLLVSEASATRRRA